MAALRKNKPFDSDALKAQVELEGQQADNVADEVDRLKKEIDDLDKDQDRTIKAHKIKALENENISNEQNRIARKEYANKTFILTCVWGGLIFIILFLNGFNAYGFNLSDKVIITLATTTTINFLGFFLLVMKYLFHTGQPKKDKNKTPKSKT